MMDQPSVTIAAAIGVMITQPPLGLFQYSKSALNGHKTVILPLAQAI
jgi:hypothetical protein